jgi:hypothetical protein
MRISSLLPLLVITGACGLAACGSTEAAPARTADDEEATPSLEQPHAVSLIPSCATDNDEGCMPPSPWVDKLCNGVHPEVALHMFRGGSPWKRLYSRARAPAYNGAGGPSLSDERVEMGEEMIALRRNTDGRGSSAGEMSVGDTAGYDLLRWNGSCVTMHDGEFSPKPPRRRQHARVEWRWLGEGVRSALQTDGNVKNAYVARRKECKGVTLGQVTKKCVEREDSLVAAIVDYVRAGGPLPEPSEQL